MGYKIQPLGQLCDVLDSKRKPITKKDRISGEYPYYGATGVLDHVEGYIFDEALVLVGEDGAKWGAGENTAFSVDGKCWVNNHAHVLRPRRDIVLDKWLIYYLNLTDLSAFITGLTVPKLNQEKLRQIPIPVPSRPEQKRIVAILDEAFEGIDRAIANTEKNLANARELFETCLNSILTFDDGEVPTRELAKLCDQNRIITYGVIKLGEEVQGGVPCLRTSNVRWLKSEIDGIKRIAPALSSSYKRTILQGGEVLVNVRGTLGGVVAVDPMMIGWNVSREVAVVPIDGKKINQRYTAYWIARRASQNWLTEVQKGVAYTGINIADLRELPVAVPSPNTQNEIVAKLEDMYASSQRLEAVYENKLSALLALKGALLAQAFSGELRGNQGSALHEAAQ